MRTRSATALHHRALVGLREGHLLRLRVAAEALHLHDPALSLEGLLPDDRADEEEHDRDAEEEAGEVERGADEGAKDQDGEDCESDLHTARQSMRSETLLGLPVASLDVLAALEGLEALVARALGDRALGGVTVEALVLR